MVTKLKRLLTEWKKVFSSYIWQRINSQNTQNEKKTKLPHNKWPNEEISIWTELKFFKVKSPNGQKTHEEMLSIPGHKGNTNQNHVKILPYSG
jgi:hypothetical protein